MRNAERLRQAYNNARRDIEELAHAMAPWDDGSAYVTVDEGIDAAGKLLAALDTGREFVGGKRPPEVASTDKP